MTCDAADAGGAGARAVRVPAGDGGGDEPGRAAQDGGARARRRGRQEPHLPHTHPRRRQVSVPARPPPALQSKSQAKRCWRGFVGARALCESMCGSSEASELGARQTADGRKKGEGRSEGREGKGREGKEGRQARGVY
eukprot:2078354-Rhodomonas_salina.1